MRREKSGCALGSAHDATEKLRPWNAGKSRCRCGLCSVGVGAGADAGAIMQAVFGKNDEPKLIIARAARAQLNVAAIAIRSGER